MNEKGVNISLRNLLSFPLRVLFLGMLLFASCLTGLVSISATELPAIFNNHMVLQRQMPVPVFGTDTPGTEVTVQFAGQSDSGTTSEDGTWSIELAAMEASAESRELTITGSKTIVLDDVLVGEVWLGGGQSNMVINVSGSGYPKTYDLTTPRPLIRYSTRTGDKVLKPFSKNPEDFQWNPEWMPATPEIFPKLVAFYSPLPIRYTLNLGCRLGSSIGRLVAIRCVHLLINS